jgi:endonuclease YncB( thermonuclease family)
VSVCTVGGTDIADWLVRNGLALDWPQYSKGGYAAAQAEAKRSNGAYGRVVSRSRGPIALANGQAEGRKAFG